MGELRAKWINLGKYSRLSENLTFEHPSLKGEIRGDYLYHKNMCYYTSGFLEIFLSVVNSQLQIHFFPLV